MGIASSMNPLFVNLMALSIRLFSREVNLMLSAFILADRFLVKQ